MLARALRFCLAAELAVYAALLVAGTELAAPLVAAAALGILLAQRALLIALTWGVAAVLHSPAPSLGVGRALTMGVGEYLAFLGHFLVLMPFSGVWMGRDRLRQSDDPLILVHGYGCNRACWWWLRRRLEAAGHVVATVDLEPPWAPIDRLAERLAARIEAVCAETGADRVSLVGHSMGGLVARALLRQPGGARVRRLVTLATPHTGSALAVLGWGANARQMEPSSTWLQALARTPPAIPVTAIRACHDNFVMPQDGQRLDGAADVALPGIGHLALLFSDAAARAVCQALAAGAGADGRAQAL